jgi:hypothetical protein
VCIDKLDAVDCREVGQGGQEADPFSSVGGRPGIPSWPAILSITLRPMSSILLPKKRYPMLGMYSTSLWIFFIFCHPESSALCTAACKNGVYDLFEKLDFP